MNKLIGVTLLLALASPTTAFAGNLVDGSKPALCAVIETVECTADRQCQHGLAGHVRMPTFFRVDFKKKRVDAKPLEGDEIVSQIKALDRTDTSLILSGSENGRGWSMVIDKKSGGMSLTLAGLDASFVVFGACTIP
jgi:hypothetical protein